jgi:hypothetical protein
MPSASRFLFTNWTKARELSVGRDEVSGVSYAYRQIGLGVTHERSVVVGPGYVKVTDRLRCKADRCLDLYWHLSGRWTVKGVAMMNPDGVNLEVACSHDFELEYWDDEPPLTSESTHYGFLRGLTLVKASLWGRGTINFISVFYTDTAPEGIFAEMRQPVMLDHARQRVAT